MANIIHIWEKNGLGKAPFSVVGLMVSDPEQCFLESPYDVGEYRIGSCAVCGIGLKNNFLIDSSDGQHFSVGCDCVASSGDGGLIDAVKGAKRTRRQLQRAAERKAQRDQWAREAEEKLTIFYSSNSDEVITLLSYNGNNDFINDIINKLTRYGYITENQMNAVIKAITSEEQRLIDEANAQPIPMTDERILISGVIVSTGHTATDFGTRFTGTIKDDRGFKVWGTVNDGEKGDRIEFMCKVSVSDKDPKFGFFKRPTKIKLNKP